MNTASYPETVRPFLDADRLAGLFAVRAAPTSEALELLAETIEALPDDELVGLAVDAGRVAADLDVIPEARALAACTARAAETAHDGLCNWDALVGLLDAGRALLDATEGERS
jgi:hypothetical protein